MYQEIIKFHGKIWQTINYENVVVILQLGRIFINLFIYFFIIWQQKQISISR